MVSKLPNCLTSYDRKFDSRRKSSNASADFYCQKNLLSTDLHLPALLDNA